MIIVILVLLAVSAFLSGFLYGTMRRPKDNREVAQGKDPHFLSSIEKEYENFLKYDGSEQS